MTKKTLLIDYVYIHTFFYIFYVYSKSLIKLDGEILKGCFANMEIQNKTILVSLEDEGGVNYIPNGLNDRPHFNAEDDDVYDSIMNCIVAD